MCVCVCVCVCGHSWKNDKGKGSVIGKKQVPNSLQRYVTCNHTGSDIICLPPSQIEVKGGMFIGICLSVCPSVSFLSKIYLLDHPAFATKLDMVLCGNLSRNELTCNLSENVWTQSSQFTEPLWTDPGIKSGISVCELISTLKKNKKKRRWGINDQTLPKSLRARKKPLPLWYDSVFL